ncbi:MAG: hypothetical protein JXX29_21190 [Deltaproteobacteria bacterium]|nr:hypothetical protein [Deltaproteobacteria bacterium]MBN2674211.1 hypothetical protein [Deltaproteobacteria bacterium]
MTAGTFPSLQVSGKTTIRKVRKVPPGASVCVRAGDVVNATDVIARAMVPGHVHSVAAAQILGVSKSRIIDALTVNVGDAVTRGQVFGRRRVMFGLFNSAVSSPVDGKVETISKVSGHVMIREAPKPVEVQAYVNGTVISADDVEGVVIQSTCALVQGVFGVGKEVIARLETDAAADVNGKAVCVFDPLTLELLNRLLRNGAVAVIAPSMDGESLLSFCGDDVNLAATGDEQVGGTLVLTEGFGCLRMTQRTREILSACAGAQVSVCGVTQVRAGVIRPELVGPAVAGANDSFGAREIGTVIQITRGEFHGEEAVISAIPSTPQTLDSGVTVLCYEVTLISDDRKIMVPRPNVA